MLWTHPHLCSLQHTDLTLSEQWTALGRSSAALGLCGVYWMFRRACLTARLHPPFSPAELCPWCAAQKSAFRVRHVGLCVVCSSPSFRIAPWAASVCGCHGDVGGCPFSHCGTCPPQVAVPSTGRPEEAAGTVWSRRRVSAGGRHGLGLGPGRRPCSASDAGC